MVVAVLDNQACQVVVGHQLGQFSGEVQAAVLGILRYPSPSSMAYVKRLTVVVEAMVNAVQGFLTAVMVS